MADNIYIPFIHILYNKHKMYNKHIYKQQVLNISNGRRHSKHWGEKRNIEGS